MREMSIEVLVATMNREEISFLENMNLTTDAVVSNQNKYKEGSKEYISSKQFIYWIDSLERGLSNSRNLALNHAKADICLIAEVDMSESSWFEGYNESYFETVGAKFYNMTNRYYKLLMLQFTLRKYSLYKNDISMINAYKLMNKGVHKYKQKYENSN